MNLRRGWGWSHIAIEVSCAVIGCPDPKLPPDVWSRRSGDRLMVQCNATDQVWYLTCRHNRWVGDTGNCSSGECMERTLWESCELTDWRDRPWACLMRSCWGRVRGVGLESTHLSVVHRNLPAFSLGTELHLRYGVGKQTPNKHEDLDSSGVTNNVLRITSNCHVCTLCDALRIIWWYKKA